MKKILSNILIRKEENKENGLFSFKKLSERFFWAIAWNSIESILYHSIFIIHQWYLFKTMDKELYGEIGTFFACSYLGVTILLGALDTAMIPWVRQFTQDKQSFKFCIRRYIYPQIILYASSPLFLWMFFKLAPLPPHFLIFKTHVFLMGIFIASEGIKKVLRHFLQLQFMNRTTAILEVIGIAMYCSLLWTWYFLGHPFSIEGVIIPFIITSQIGVIFCLKKLYAIYKQLPQKIEPAENLPSWNTFSYLRIVGSINQITRSLFSTNILVPISSIILDFVQTAGISFFNYVSHTLTFFIYKICGPAAGAFFGYATHCSHTDQKKAFILTLKIVSGIVMCAVILSSCISLYGIHMFSDAGKFDSNALIFLAILLILHIMENIFIIYEKFLIIRNKSGLLALLNIIHLSVCYTIMYQDFKASTIIFLCFLGRALVLIGGFLLIVMVKK